MKNSQVIWFVTLILAVSAMFLLQSCDFGNGTGPIDQNYPRNVRMVIADDSVATRDTVVHVYNYGENIQLMQIGADSLLNDVPWEEFSRIKSIEAPRIEGIFNAYGRFATLGGGTTGVLHDDILLDFSAHIDTFIVSADNDTLMPGDEITFYIETKESGAARVDFGGFISGFSLTQIDSGIYQGSITITDGIQDSAAIAVAKFIDFVGNEADSVVYAETFTILGSALHPELIADLDMPGVQGVDVFLKSGYCYVSDWSGVIHLIYVGLPEEGAVLLDSLLMVDWISGMDGRGQYLYVAYGNVGLAVIDISHLDQPVRVASLSVVGQPRDIVISGDYAYLACNLSGLKIFNLDNPDYPQEISDILLTNFGQHIRYSDDIVYIAGSWGGSIIDVHDPLNPQLIKEFQVDGNPISMTYDSGYLYFGTDERGLAVYDVQMPSKPTLVATYSSFRKLHTLEISYPFLLTGGDWGFSVLNMADPANISEVAEVRNLDGIRGMHFDGRYAYLARTEGFAIIDLFPEVN